MKLRIATALLGLLLAASLSGITAQSAFAGGGTGGGSGEPVSGDGGTGGGSGKP